MDERELRWHCPHCGDPNCTCVACDLMFDAHPPEYLAGRFHPHTCTRMETR